MTSLHTSLAALVREHGAAEVVRALRDGCDACAELTGAKGDRIAEYYGDWRTASRQLDLAADEIEEADAPTLDAGLDALATPAPEDPESRS